MALYHFKKEFISDQSLYDGNEKFVGGNFKKTSTKCFHCEKRGGNVFMSEINLGDVLRKTISEELSSLNSQNGNTWLRNGWAKQG